MPELLHCIYFAAVGDLKSERAHYCNVFRIPVCIIVITAATFSR